MLHAAIISLITASNVHGQMIQMHPEWEEVFWEIKPLYKCDTLTISITGDIMMHSMQIEKALKADGTYGFSSYFRHIEDQIKDADIAIGNMEFTLGGKPYAGYPAFSAPDSYAEYLAGTGFDVFLLANNHIFDKGASGARRTLELYRMLEESNGIKTTGLAS
jgi:poly-gamma-glutamate synthesis protein (capsule biosynthesis protein)